MRRGYLVIFLLLISFQSFTPSEELRIVPIHEIQGNKKISEFTGKKVVVKGIVTAMFPGKDGLNGFFIQELEEDDDPDTSEGIFIYDPNNIFEGSRGDIVEVSGEVAEYKSNGSSLTQISKVSSVHLISSKNKLPKPLQIKLPIANWEKYEGMLVEIAGPLYITELYQLGRYGQLTLSADSPLNQGKTDGRLDQFTQFNSPDAEAYAAYMEQTKMYSILIDDGSSVQNPAEIPFGREKRNFDMFHAVRAGDQTKSVTGILDERFGDYRIHPTQTIDFKPTNKRKAKPPRMPLGTNLKVAGFNVLNYFNGDGKGGGFPTERGAKNIAEFERQRTKTIGVLQQADADIISLMEMENDGFEKYSSLEELTNDLNWAFQSKKDYDFVRVDNTGKDVITSAIIFDHNKVEPIGKPVSIPDQYGFGSFDIALRKPIIQTFRHKKTQVEFTVVSIHFKSKGYLVSGERNKDQKDGQGQNNEVRLRQAQDLLFWLDTNPTGTGNRDYLLIGDFNAYYMEDPLTYLTDNGFFNAFPPHSYSFVYGGYWGALDHALVSPKLYSQLSKAVKWHINADEAGVLDYSMQYKTPEQTDSFFDSSVFRSSDHDPIILGFRLKKIKEAKD